MILRKITLSLLPLLFFATCFNGADIKGRVVIEYDGAWSAVITEGYNESSRSGNGRGEFIYFNPDSLKVKASKLDSSLNKLIIYIYEDERIVAGGSTREPGGSASAEYVFPY